MKKYFKKLCAVMLVVTMMATNALPVAAAEKPVHNHAAHLEMAGIDMSALSAKALKFIAEYTATEEFKSAFGKTVEGYNTEALKNAIWEAIFVRRDANMINVESLGIPQDVMYALTDEVLAEANAEGAVTYSVKKDTNGDATVMEVAIDPLYAAAYDEIEMATSNTEENATTDSISGSSEAKIVLAAEGDGAAGSEGETQEPTMEDAIATFNAYQQFIDDNPDYFGITVPYNSVKDDEHQGTGPISSIMAIVGAGEVPDENGLTSYDYFVMGYIPASDLIQIIQMFDTGNQLGVALLGEELLATKNTAVKAIPTDVTDIQKLLLLTDWLADNATFDMARIMEIQAPQPAENQFFYTVVGALQQQGLPEEDAQMFAQQLMGLWGGNQFGVLTDSMGRTGVCMSYTYAYAYLVQWIFNDVYKNSNGTWKSRLELNYIDNPEAEVVSQAVALVAEEGGEPIEEVCEHELVATWAWAENYASATVTVTCSKCEETIGTATDDDIQQDFVEPTCGEYGATIYSAAATVEGQEFTDTQTVRNVAEPPVGNHTYTETSTVVWEWVSEDEAYASVTCDKCTHIESVEAVVELDEEKSSASTCEEKGKNVYAITATIAEVEYTSEHEVELALADHTYGADNECTVCGILNPDHEHAYAENVTWGEWTEENKVSATLACTLEGCEHAKELTVDVSNVVTAPTCTEAGFTTYTATATVDEDTTVINPETKVVEGEAATGHQYDETVAPDAWVWADDYSKATAVYNCTVEGCEGTTEITADVTMESTVTSCTEGGTETYTATITYGEGETAGTYTDVKTVEVAAGKHKIDATGLCTVCGEANIPSRIWDPSAPAMVDYVKIQYNADFTMYGEPQDTFQSAHYWNAVKVDGQWYYVDPCYTDIFIECMERERVETDGNINHMYFMFSDTTARSLYDGYYMENGLDSLYQGIATDKTYEDAWFAFAKSPVYKSGDKYYYFYDSTDLIGTLDSINSDDQSSTGDMMNDEDDFRLVYYQGTTSDGSDYTQTLINFVDGTVYTKNGNSATMVENEMLVELYAEHEMMKENYPSVEISCDMEGSKLYFNLANCVLYYDVDTCEVVKVFEYNEVTADRDLSIGLGGMAFFVVDPDEVEAPEAEEITRHTVFNNPIASMTIKNGNMYVSVGTTIAFISGRQSMEEDDSMGYQFEETNYNVDYNMYQESSGYGDGETNDNDEFMWSANFVDIIEMSHINGGEHTYEEVYVHATCGENAYTENRCVDCGAIEADSRVDVEDTALEHHYIKFDEQYYTKEGDAWNTGTSYVCTICKDAKDPDELEDADHVGHVYAGYAKEWNEDYTEAVMDVACEACYGVNFDCVLADEEVVIAEDLVTTDITKERYSEVIDEETGEKAYYWMYTAAVEHDGETYTDSIFVEREEDKYDRNPFTDVPNDKWFTDAVLWANENGYVAGYEEEDGTLTFRPNNNATRAESVTFLWRIEGEEESEDVENPFTDIKEGKWYYEEVLWAYDNEITVGYEEADGTFTFRPDNNCTRAEILAFICRVKGNPTASEGVENPFTDIEEGKWYYNDVMWAVEQGIVSGYEEADGTFTFRPNAKCTRAEIVQMLYTAFAEE